MAPWAVSLRCKAIAEVRPLTGSHARRIRPVANEWLQSYPMALVGRAILCTPERITLTEGKDYSSLMDLTYLGTRGEIGSRLATGNAARLVRQLPDAALIEKWPGRSLTAGIAPGHHWSRSRSQLHTLDICIERGRCRRWNQYRLLDHSAVSQSARYYGRCRCWASAPRPSS